jgi:hypothetical protein
VPSAHIFQIAQTPSSGWQREKMMWSALGVNFGV